MSDGKKVHWADKVWQDWRDAILAAGGTIRRESHGSIDFDLTPEQELRVRETMDGIYGEGWFDYQGLTRALARKEFAPPERGG
jgi:hypothetical protein